MIESQALALTEHHRRSASYSTLLECCPGTCWRDHAVAQQEFWQHLPKMHESPACPHHDSMIHADRVSTKQHRARKSLKMALLCKGSCHGWCRIGCSNVGRTYATKSPISKQVVHGFTVAVLLLANSAILSTLQPYECGCRVDEVQLMQAACAAFPLAHMYSPIAKWVSMLKQSQLLCRQLQFISLVGHSLVQPHLRQRSEQDDYACRPGANMPAWPWLALDTSCSLQ